MRRLQQHFQGLHLISEGVELLLRLQGLHLGSKAGKGCKNIYIYTGLVLGYVFVLNVYMYRYRSMSLWRTTVKRQQSRCLVLNKLFYMTVYVIRE